MRLIPNRPRIFPSLCDWLDEEVPIEWLADFLKLIHDTPNLDWLLLTKRPENFRSRLNIVRNFWVATQQTPWGWLNDWIAEDVGQIRRNPQNVWLGVSVEDQKRADERIPLLLQIPAKVRFLSVEPLLEDVKIRLDNEMFPMVDWVIVGGESLHFAVLVEVVERWNVRTSRPDANKVHCRVYQDSAIWKQRATAKAYDH